MAPAAGGINTRVGRGVMGARTPDFGGTTRRGDKQFAVGYEFPIGHRSDSSERARPLREECKRKGCGFSNLIRARKVTS